MDWQHSIGTVVKNCAFVLGFAALCSGALADEPQGDEKLLQEFAPRVLDALGDSVSAATLNSVTTVLQGVAAAEDPCGLGVELLEVIFNDANTSSHTVAAEYADFVIANLPMSAATVASVEDTGAQVVNAVKSGKVRSVWKDIMSELRLDCRTYTWSTTWGEIRLPRDYENFDRFLELNKKWETYYRNENGQIQGKMILLSYDTDARKLAGRWTQTTVPTGPNTCTVWSGTENWGPIEITLEEDFDFFFGEWDYCPAAKPDPNMTINGELEK